MGVAGLGDEVVDGRVCWPAVTRQVKVLATVVFAADHDEGVSR